MEQTTAGACTRILRVQKKIKYMFLNAIEIDLLDIAVRKILENHIEVSHSLQPLAKS